MEDQKELRRKYLERKEYQENIITLSGGIPQRPRRFSELPDFIGDFIGFSLNYFIECTKTPTETKESDY